jgi:hypothetical protein
MSRWGECELLEPVIAWAVRRVVFPDGDVDYQPSPVLFAAR